ncbi:MAG: PLP-dependent cysteine synthase family protein [Pseudobdellovibrionaceae bacterium]
MNRRSTLDLIGNTPLLTLDRLYHGPGLLMAKAEFMQPGGSVKDRPAKKIVEDARTKGILKEKMPVVEMTSGNMGAGLAVVCAVLKHPFTAVMSAGNSPERVKMLHGLGAKVVLVPQVNGVPGQVTGADIAKATEVAKMLAQEKKAFYVDQFNNPNSILAHEETTGPEIWNETNGQLQAYVASVGSGGTFVGTAKYLKRKNPAVICAAVEPLGSEVLAGKNISKPKHMIQGTGYGSIPPHWDNSVCDKYLAVADEEADHYRTLLSKEEGLFVGYSAAANVAASVKLLESSLLGSSPTVVTVLCDTGFKY